MSNNSMKLKLSIATLQLDQRLPTVDLSIVCYCCVTYTSCGVKITMY